MRLVTHMYFPGHPLNERDFIYLAVPARERERVLARPGPASSGDPTYTFDFVLRGRQCTSREEEEP